MSLYYQYDNAFANNDNDNLDKLARKINNSHKKTYKEARDHYRKQTDNICSGIDSLTDPSNARFAPSNILNTYSYINNNSDFGSDLPTPLQQSDNSLQEESHSADSINSSFAGITNFSEEDAISSISSNYSRLTKKQKKYLRQNNKHLKNFNDKNTIDHIEDCDQCKFDFIKIMNLLKHQNNIEIKPEPIKENKILNLSTPELKDVLILILAGILIIIVFDSCFRRS